MKSDGRKLIRGVSCGYGSSTLERPFHGGSKITKIDSQIRHDCLSDHHRVRLAVRPFKWKNTPST